MNKVDINNPDQEIPLLQLMRTDLEDFRSSDTSSLAKHAMILQSDVESLLTYLKEGKVIDVAIALMQGDIKRAEKALATTPNEAFQGIVDTLNTSRFLNGFENSAYMSPLAPAAKTAPAAARSEPLVTETTTITLTHTQVKPASVLKPLHPDFKHTAPALLSGEDAELFKMGLWNNGAGISSRGHKASAKAAEYFASPLDLDDLQKLADQIRAHAFESHAFLTAAYGDNDDYFAERFQFMLDAAAEINNVKSVSDKKGLLTEMHILTDELSQLVTYAEDMQAELAPAADTQARVEAPAQTSKTLNKLPDFITNAGPVDYTEMKATVLAGASESKRKPAATKDTTPVVSENEIQTSAALEQSWLEKPLGEVPAAIRLNAEAPAAALAANVFNPEGEQLVLAKIIGSELHSILKQKETSDATNWTIYAALNTLGTDPNRALIRASITQVYGTEGKLTRQQRDVKKALRTYLKSFHEMGVFANGPYLAAKSSEAPNTTAINLAHENHKGLARKNWNSLEAAAERYLNNDPMPAQKSAAEIALEQKRGAALKALASRPVLSKLDALGTLSVNMAGAMRNLTTLAEALTEGNNTEIMGFAGELYNSTRSLDLQTVTIIRAGSAYIKRDDVPADTINQHRLDVANDTAAIADHIRKAHKTTKNFIAQMKTPFVGLSHDTQTLLMLTALDKQLETAELGLPQLEKSQRGYMSALAADDQMNSASLGNNLEHFYMAHKNRDQSIESEDLHHLADRLMLRINARADNSAIIHALETFGSASASASNQKRVVELIKAQKLEDNARNHILQNIGKMKSREIDNYLDSIEIAGGKIDTLLNGMSNAGYKLLYPKDKKPSAVARFQKGLADHVSSLAKTLSAPAGDNMGYAGAHIIAPIGDAMGLMPFIIATDKGDTNAAIPAVQTEPKAVRENTMLKRAHKLLNGEDGAKPALDLRAMFASARGKLALKTSASTVALSESDKPKGMVNKIAAFIENVGEKPKPGVEKPARVIKQPVAPEGYGYKADGTPRDGIDILGERIAKLGRGAKTRLKRKEVTTDDIDQDSSAVAKPVIKGSRIKPADMGAFAGTPANDKDAAKKGWIGKAAKAAARKWPLMILGLGTGFVVKGAVIAAVASTGPVAPVIAAVAIGAWLSGQMGFHYDESLAKISTSEQQTGQWWKKRGHEVAATAIGIGHLALNTLPIPYVGKGLSKRNTVAAPLIAAYDLIIGTHNKSFKLANKEIKRREKAGEELTRSQRIELRRDIKKNNGLTDYQKRILSSAIIGGTLAGLGATVVPMIAEKIGDTAQSLWHTLQQWMGGNKAAAITTSPATVVTAPVVAAPVPVQMDPAIDPIRPAATYEGLQDMMKPATLTDSAAPAGMIETGLRGPITTGDLPSYIAEPTAAPADIAGTPAVQAITPDTNTIMMPATPDAAIKVAPDAAAVTAVNPVQVAQPVVTTPAAPVVTTTGTTGLLSGNALQTAIAAEVTDTGKVSLFVSNTPEFAAVKTYVEGLDVPASVADKLESLVTRAEAGSLTALNDLRASIFNSSLFENGRPSMAFSGAATGRQLGEALMHVQNDVLGDVDFRQAGFESAADMSQAHEAKWEAQKAASLKPVIR